MSKPRAAGDPSPAPEVQAVLLPMPPERYNTLYGPGLLTQIIMDLTECHGRIAAVMSPMEMREVVELARVAERLRLLRGGAA